MIEKEDGEVQQLQRGPLVSNEGRVFTRRSLNPPTAFEQKLHVAAAEAAREREKQLRSVKSNRLERGNAESMKVWREHYRQAFPTYVFYFDSVPEDIRTKAAKQLARFGAVSLKFSFCGLVLITHLILGHS
jgi:regulatory subunit for Cdc7p protein kinase